MNLKPMHDWAVIRPSEARERTESGLYIPDSAKEKPQEGTIEAIGPGALEEEKRGKKAGEKKERRFIPTTVRPGDRVIYERYAGQTYKIGEEEWVLVRERDILGTLPERPLQIPSSTTASGMTALAKPLAEPAAEQTSKAGEGKKTVEKAVTKPAPKKKNENRVIRKASPKKKAPKKAVKKAVVKKKAGKKAVAKPAKKATKAAAKPVKKAVKKKVKPVKKAQPKKKAGRKARKA